MEIMFFQLISVILFVTELTFAKQTFDTLPEDAVARPGESVILKCVINRLKGTCFWRLGGQVRAVQDFKPAGSSSTKYEWVNGNTGDCSLRVFNAVPDDEGIWICEVTSSNEGVEDSLKAELYLSVGDNCRIGRPCSKSGEGRLTGRPVRYSPKSFKAGFHHPFGAILRGTYWNRTPKPMGQSADEHPFFEGLRHRHYHHEHDFFG